MLVLKIGGGAAIDLDAIARDLAMHKGRCIVVLGANATRDDLAARLGVAKRVVTSVSGYSSVFSDDEAIDLLMLAYAGRRAGLLVQALQRVGINAVSLSGLDGRVIQGRRNAGIRVREDGRTLLLRDRSGKPAAVNRHLLDLLLDAGYLPVLTMPIADEAGWAINSENDDVVVALHRAYGADVVVHLVEAAGLLRDAADPHTRIDSLPAQELERWETEATARMKRKLRAIGRLFEGTPPSRVVIADGRLDAPLRRALAGEGTVIRAVVEAPRG